MWRWLLLLALGQSSSRAAQQPAATQSHAVVPVPIANRRLQVPPRAIHFQTDTATILPESTVWLQRIAYTLQQHREILSVEIQVHLDCRGSMARVQQLSQDRAEAVRAALLALGVAPERLVARGYGCTRPVIFNITPATRQSSRRIIFEITRVASARR